MNLSSSYISLCLYLKAKNLQLDYFGQSQPFERKGISSKMRRKAGTLGFICDVPSEITFYWNMNFNFHHFNSKEIAFLENSFSIFATNYLISLRSIVILGHSHTFKTYKAYSRSQVGHLRRKTTWFCFETRFPMDKKTSLCIFFPLISLLHTQSGHSIKNFSWFIKLPSHVRFKYAGNVRPVFSINFFLLFFYRISDHYNQAP